MLRELLGCCLPILLHTPLVDPLNLPAIDEANLDWPARLTRWAEDKQFVQIKRYGGLVIALTEDSITVKLRNRIPRTFSVAAPLLHKDVPLIPSVNSVGLEHRLYQVQVGDTVDINVVPVPGGHLCTEIGICWRPGGTIPRGDDSNFPEHLRGYYFSNALMFVHEKVIPVLPSLVMRLGSLH